MSVSKTTLGVVGILGSLFIGYCVYFDRLRRKDPNFKKKLRESRKNNKIICRREKSIEFPNMANQESVQAYFFDQVRLGEELLGQGNIESGLEHLCNAVKLCSQPHEILGIFQQALPPVLFVLLVKKLPNFTQQLTENGDTILIEDGAGVA